jgi:hypothetical protein
VATTRQPLKVATGVSTGSDLEGTVVKRARIGTVQERVERIEYRFGPFPLPPTTVSGLPARHGAAGSAANRLDDSPHSNGRRLRHRVRARQSPDAIWSRSTVQEAFG